MGDFIGWAIIAGVVMYFIGYAFWKVFGGILEIILYVVTGIALVGVTLALPLLLVFGGFKAVSGAYARALSLRSRAPLPPGSA